MNRTLTVLSASTLLAACTTPLPNVQYREYPCSEPACGQSTDSLLRFTLSKTVVRFSSKNDTQGDFIPSDESGITATPGRVEWEENGLSPRMFEILRDDPWGEKTTLTATKIDGTDSLQSVGVEVNDERSSNITKYVGIASNILGIATILISKGGDNENPPPKFYLRLPIALDTYQLLKGTKATSDSGTGYLAGDQIEGKKFSFDYTVGPAPLDSIALDTYLKNNLNKRKNEIFFPACRTMTVRFPNGQPYADVTNPLQGRAWTFLVSDPRYVQVAQFPAKGKVTMKPVCGADVTSEAVAVSSTLDVTNTISAQLKVLAQSWKTLKDERAKK
ncbi:hypothetical protein ACF8FG_20785 [Pseudomonas sp. YQ_6]